MKGGGLCVCVCRFCDMYICRIKIRYTERYRLRVVVTLYGECKVGGLVVGRLTD